MSQASAPAGVVNLGQVKIKTSQGNDILPDVTGLYGDWQMLYTPIDNPNWCDYAFVFTVYKDPVSEDVLLWNDHAGSCGYVFANQDGNGITNAILFYNYNQGGGWSEVSANTRFQLTSNGGTSVDLFNRRSWMKVGLRYTDGSGGDGTRCWLVTADCTDNAMMPFTLEGVGGTNAEVLIMRAAKQCAGADFTNADFAGTELNHANFAGVKSIQGADFQGCQLQQCQFAGFDLGSAKTFAQADFTGSDLTNIASAANGSFAGCNLSGCNLTNVRFDGADLSGAKFAGATLAGTVFAGCDLKGADFSGCDLTRARFDPTPRFSYASSQPMDFTNATVPFAVVGRDWSYFILNGASIADLPTTTLSSQSQPLIATGSDLRGLKNSLQGVMLANAQLSQARLGGLDLAGGTLTNADLSSADLSGAHLHKANLEQANLTAARLHGAVMTNVNLASANCTSAQFMVAGAPQPDSAPDSSEAQSADPAILTDAFMPNANLDNAMLQGANLDNVQFYFDQLRGPTRPSARNASFVGARMGGAFCVGADFSGADTTLNGAVLRDAILVAAKFEQADLSASGSAEHPTTTLTGADIRGTLFAAADGSQQANMDGADLEGAKVSGSEGCTFLTTITANFDGSQILVEIGYGTTVLGITNQQTTCPDGSQGPCG